jgi:hypothetical protein
VDYRNSTASGKAEARTLPAAIKPVLMPGQDAGGFFSLKSRPIIRKKW